MASTSISQSQSSNASREPSGTMDEQDLVAALRAGDEQAFVTLVEHYRPTMIRLARVYTPDDAVAEEVVQETWLAVIQGLPRFEGRCALKTWIFRILTN